MNTDYTHEILDTWHQRADKHRTEALLASLLLDVGGIADPNPWGEEIVTDWLEDADHFLYDIDDSTWRPAIENEFNTLTWFPDRGSVSCLGMNSTDPHQPTPVDIRCEHFAWLKVEFEAGEMTAIPRGTLRDVRQVLIEQRAGERPGSARLRRVSDNFVLFVVIDGPDYNVPDLAVVGPAAPGNAPDDGGAPERVKTLFFDFNRKFERGVDSNMLRDLLSPLSQLGTNNWRAVFEVGASTRAAVRRRFTNRMKKRVEELMNLLDQTARSNEAGFSHPALEDLDEHARLEAIREAAILIVFRLMFLAEMENRRLLYQGPAPASGDAVLKQLAAQIDQTVEGDEPADADMLRRFVYLVRAVRGDDEFDDEDVVLRGASIFDDQPNERFPEAPAVWLEALDAHVEPDQIAPDPLDDALERRWNRALASAYHLVTGFIGDDEQLARTKAGAGGAEHTHRVFGDVYEQLLRFSPNRSEDGRIVIEIDDEERNKVAAHYTPAELVEEIVRPTLGHLFEQIWEECDGDWSHYIERLRAMRVVDPAMGSGHFLTVAALELSREIAWADINHRPRPFAWHEPLSHANPIGWDPGDEDHPDHDPDWTLHTAGPRDELHEYHGPNANADSYNARVVQALSHVVQHGIYGVDIKPLACELGKLALWLFTMTARQEVDDGSKPDPTRPDLASELVYLNANIRSGDSLVGLELADVYDTFDGLMRKDAKSGGTLGLFDLSNTRAETLRERRAIIEALHELLRAPRQALADIVGTNGDWSGVRQWLDDKDDAHLMTWVDQFWPDYFDDAPRETIPELRDQLLERARDLRAELAWLYDLAVMAKYHGYTSSQASADSIRAFVALLTGEHDASLSKDAGKDIAEETLSTLLERPFDADPELARLKTRVRAAAAELGAFHWELEFPATFERGGFDAVVANPPFIGDRDLRERLGSEELVEYLSKYFIADGKKPDYSGYFFWRYDQIVNPSGAVGSLASNSIAQASNREYITKPLTVGDEPRFRIFRAIPNRGWTGEANVHFAAMNLGRRAGTFRRIIRPDFEVEDAPERPFELKHSEPISSYLDEYPDYDIKPLLTSGGQIFAYTGMFMRGNFSIHREPGQKLADAYQAVPEDERDALAAYLNTNAIQQQPRPTPPDIVVDFYPILKREDLEDAKPEKQLKYLSENYPATLRFLKERSPHVADSTKDEDRSVFEQRMALSDSSSDAGHKEFWWLYGSVRQGLRRAWHDVDEVLAFPRVTKAWSPLRLPKTIKVENQISLRICPMDNLQIALSLNVEHNAVVFSFLFEMIARRQCSSLETRLRFTPTKVFPYFPWPWEPTFADGRLTIGEPPDEMRASLASAAERLLDVRTDLLEHPDRHGLTRELIGGPTDLYNLYNRDLGPFGAGSAAQAEAAADSEAIDELRRAHVALLDAVLRAYGWDDLADKCTFEQWLIDRPWLDRSPRFVPAEPVRAELFARIDTLNSQRYHQELDILGTHVIEVVGEAKRTQNQHWEAVTDSGVDIDRDTCDRVMERLYERDLLERSGTSGSSKWWVK